MESLSYFASSAAVLSKYAMHLAMSSSSAWLCARHVREVVVVEESSLARAVELSLREEKQVLEGSGAAAVTALIEGKRIPGEGPVCLVLTGRNIDRDRLRELVQGMTAPA